MRIFKYTVLVFTALLGFSELCFSLESETQRTAFDQYENVYSDDLRAIYVYVFDKTQFLGNRNKTYWQNIDGNDIETTAIGDIVFSPSQRIYITQAEGGFQTCLEIRSSEKNTLLLDKICEYRNIALLFNGRGALYVSTHPDTCSGGKITQKFQLIKDKLQQIQQPLLFWEDVATELTVDLTLYSIQDASSTSVAKLNKGAKVQVLTRDNSWYLIKSPLGLTGWVSSSPPPFSYSRSCN